MWKFFRNDVAFPIFLCLGALLANFQRKRFSPEVFNLAAGVICVLLIFLTAGAAFVELRQRLDKGESPIKLKDPYWILVGITGIAIFTFVLSGYLFSVADVARATYSWLSEPTVDRIEASAVVAVLVAASGLALFWFRLVARACYGAVEVVVGIYVAASQVQQVAPGVPVTQTSVLLALLTAGVYLVVRGLDNVHQGCKAEKPDRIALFFIRKLTRSKVATQGASVERPK